MQRLNLKDLQLVHSRIGYQLLIKQQENRGLFGD
jgi:hypothetical protein